MATAAKKKPNAPKAKAPKTVKPADAPASVGPELGGAALTPDPNATFGQSTDGVERKRFIPFTPVDGVGYNPRGDG